MEIGTTKNTLIKFRKFLVKNMGEIYCPCGAPTNHRGYCWHKFKGDFERVREGNRIRKLFEQSLSTKYPNIQNAQRERRKREALEKNTSS